MNASSVCSEVRFTNTLAAAPWAADGSYDRLILKTSNMMFPDARLFI